MIFLYFRDAAYLRAKLKGKKNRRFENLRPLFLLVEFKVASGVVITDVLNHATQNLHITW